METCVFGLAFQANLRVDSPTNDVHTCTVLSMTKNAGHVYRPETFTFEMPSSDQFLRRRAGTSEIHGIYGGVADEYQRACSEVTERGIGDVLTLALCDALDGPIADLHIEEPLARGQKCSGHRALVFVLGPALPKVVGRFASLRPPPCVEVYWIYSTNIVRWLASETNDLSFPSVGMTDDISFGDVWYDEAIINTFLHPTRPLTVQRLNLFGDTWTEPPAGALDGHGWSSIDPVIVGTEVPRELAVATDQIDVQGRPETRYADDEEQEVNLAPGRITGELLSAAPSRGRGWQVSWR